uniref:Uncharacterized protein n=1 Tax=Rhizophora mucronata TaxID=61149 RepID=A0A2P2PMS3_RHIMU
MQLFIHVQYSFSRMGCLLQLGSMRRLASTSTRTRMLKENKI